jgi:hypothetical protein
MWRPLLLSFPSRMQQISVCRSPWNILLSEDGGLLENKLLLIAVCGCNPVLSALQPPTDLEEAVCHSVFQS